MVFGWEAMVEVETMARTVDPALVVQCALVGLWVVQVAHVVVHHQDVEADHSIVPTIEVLPQAAAVVAVVLLVAVKLLQAATATATTIVVRIHQ